MKQKEFEIRNRLGIHARPAAMFVQAANKFRSKIRVIKDEQEVDGKSIMGILMLAAEYRSTLTVIVEGDDEEAMLNAIEELIESKFRED